MEGLVSVIVPVYNAEKYLESALEDIVKQTYNNLEIILVNDGSNDNSYTIMKQFAYNDKRIQIIDIDNGGPSNARNIGLDFAKGEYIRFIDADDRIPHNSIEEMVRVYSEFQNTDIVIGNYLSIPEKYLMTGDNIKAGLVTSEDFLDVFIENVRSFYIGVPWNKLYKRDLIERYHIRFNKNIVWCEDFLFNIEYYDKCKFIYLLHVKDGIYKYILRDDSITHIIKKNDDINMIKKINRLRYERAKDYCKKNGKESFFELEWKCSNVYTELSELTKFNSKLSISKRYIEFVKILSNPQTYEYIYMKTKNTDVLVWKIMEYLTKKRLYRIAFWFFLLKGYMVTNMKGITNLIKRKFKHYVPPNL